MRRVLKLCMMSIPYKSKPIHEKIIQQFVIEVRNSPQLQDIVPHLNIGSLAQSAGTIAEETKLDRRTTFLSPA